MTREQDTSIIILMEPPSENRPTIETAREKGLQNLDKVLKFIAPVFSPGTLAEVGKYAVQDKINEAKERMDALKLRVETKALEIRNAATEKWNAAYDRFETRFNAAKDKTSAVAKEVGRRAKVVGLTPIAGAEALYVEIYKIPAGIRESIAEAKQGKIDNLKDKLKVLEAQKKDHKEKAKEIRERAAKKTVARTALDRVRVKA